MSNKKPKNLNNYLNKIVEHKALSCIIAILMFVLPLIVVHFLFKWNSNIEWIQAEWDAGDVISYIAGFSFDYMSVSEIDDSQMSQKNFAAHQNEDDTSGEFRFGFVFDSEHISYFNSYTGKQKCNSADE